MSSADLCGCATTPEPPAHRPRRASRYLHGSASKRFETSTRAALESAANGATFDGLRTAKPSSNGWSVFAEDEWDCAGDRCRYGEKPEEERPCEQVKTGLKLVRPN